MIYGVVLASGKGTRMANQSGKPKQFMLIDDVPVVIYTLSSMLKINKFDKIYLVVSPEYIEYANELVMQYTSDYADKVLVVAGGKERIDSIDNAINKIKEDNKITDNDVVVIHDGVRPFVTEKVLLANIAGARKYGAVVSAVPVSDTLLISNEGEIVDDIPPRKLYYKGQAPDSFKLSLFISLLDKLTAEQRQKLTGTSQVCTLNNYPIHMVLGDDINFKITTKSDYDMAVALVRSINNDKQ